VKTAPIIPPDRQLAEEIIKSCGFSISKLGLRFDRVVVRILADLRHFADGSTPSGMTILLTLTAPIRNPARTAGILEKEIQALFAEGTVGEDRRAIVHGNLIRMRLVRHGPRHRQKFIGFVHNPDSDATRLLDLAEQWLARA
jgi:hypothetical protein